MCGVLESEPSSLVLSQTSFAHRSEFVQHIFSFQFNQSRLKLVCECFLVFFLVFGVEDFR